MCVWMRGGGLRFEAGREGVGLGVGRGGEASGGPAAAAAARFCFGCASRAAFPRARLAPRSGRERIGGADAGPGVRAGGPAGGGGWVGPGLAVAADPEDGGALRGVEPLVRVGDVEVRAERGHVEGDVAKRVRAVDEDRDAAGAAEGGDAGDGEDDGGAGGDVVDGGDGDGRLRVECVGHRLRAAPSGAGEDPARQRGWRVPPAAWQRT